MVAGIATVTVEAYVRIVVVTVPSKLDVATGDLAPNGVGGMTGPAGGKDSVTVDTGTDVTPIVLYKTAESFGSSEATIAGPDAVRVK